jgi:transcription initiation factor TFIID subunit 5
MSDSVVEATKAFAAAFNFKNIQPHGETLEEMIRSTEYLESTPITFTYSFEGPREADPVEIYSSYLDFVKKNSQHPELNEILFPLFCRFIINYKMYGDDAGGEAFADKFKNTVPEKFKEELNLFLTDEDHYQQLACKISTQRYIFRCSENVATLLTNFVNKIRNSQLRAVITDIISIWIHKEMKRSKPLRFLIDDRMEDISILHAKIQGCNIAALPHCGPYVYAALDNHEVIRLETETHTSRVLSTHSAPITTLATSQHGMICVSADAGGCARVWSKTASQELPEVSCPIWCSAFAPEGGCFVLGYDDGTSKIFRADTCKPIRCMVGHIEAVSDVAFHPNCSLIATSSTDNSIRLWDIRTPETVRLFIAKSAPSGLSLSPNGKSLSFYDGVVRLCDLGSGEEKGTLLLPSKEVSSIEFVGNGSNVVAVAPQGDIYSVNFEENTVKEITSVDGRVVFCGTSQQNELRIVTSE